MQNIVGLALAAGSIATSGGGSGLLSIPSASLMPARTIQWDHSNALLPARSRSVVGLVQDQIDDAVVDHLQISVFKNIEFGARLTTWYNRDSNARDVNDLSPHIKIRLYNSEHFQLTIGARDFAGEAITQAPAEFLLTDFTYKNFTATAGYGRADVTDVALNGPFGGIRYSPLSWLDVLADYDGVYGQLGLVFRTTGRRWSAYAKAYVSQNEVQSSVISAGLRLPLGQPSRKIKRKPRPDLAQQTLSPIAGLGTPVVHELSLGGEIGYWLSQQFLNQSIAASRGWCGQRYDVRYHSVELLSLDCTERDYVVNWSSRPEIGKVESLSGTLDLAMQTALLSSSSDFPAPAVSPQSAMQHGKRDLNFGRLEHFLADDSAKSDIKPTVLPVKKRHFLGSANPALISMRIQPTQRYAVGSEFGRLEYSLALQSTALVSLTRGLTVNLSWNSSSFNTDSYKKGGAFEDKKLKSGLNESTVQHTKKLIDGLLIQGTAGRSVVDREDIDFWRADLAWSAFDGRLTLAYSHTDIDPKNSTSAEQQRLLKAFVWFQPGRTALEITAGDFLFEDRGFRTNLWRYLGRHRLGLFYKNGENQEAAGLSIAFGLGKSRLIESPWLQVQGPRRLRTSVESQIGTGTGINNLRPNFLFEFSPTINLYDDVLDDWRISPIYVRSAP